MKKFLVLIPILLLATAFLPNCSGSDTATGPQPTPTATLVSCGSPTSVGYITFGSTDGHPGGSSLFANPVTLSSTTAAVSFTIGIGSAYAPPTHAVFGIYADNGSNQPGSLIATTTTESSFSTGGVWNSFALTTTPTLTAGTYWLAALYTTDGSQYFSSSVTKYYYVAGYSGTSLPAAFPLTGSGAGSNSSTRISMYMSTCP